jgi:hypothetical protein
MKVPKMTTQTIIADTTSCQRVCGRAGAWVSTAGVPTYPLMTRSTLSTFAPLMEEAVDEAKQSIDRALDNRRPE